jgi:cell division protein FtsB
MMLLAHIPQESIFILNERRYNTDAVNHNRGQHTMAQQTGQPDTPPTDRPDHQISSTQVVFAVILAIGLMLAINFSNRITDERRLTGVRSAIEQEIDLLRREQADLIEQLSYAESPAYVEAWAHSEGKMVRQGETLVVPIPADAAQTDSTPADAPSAASLNNLNMETTLPEPAPWELWWGLFFDTPSPG